MAPDEFSLRAGAALRALESWSDELQEEQRGRAAHASLLLQAGDVQGALRELAALATSSVVEEVRTQWLALGDDVVRRAAVTRP